VQKGDATAEKQFDALLAQAEIIWLPRPLKDMITRAYPPFVGKTNFRIFWGNSWK